MGCFFNGLGFKVGLIRDLVESFFRAALLEEIFKFYGFMKANNKYQFKTEKEYMIGAGMVGLAYAVIGAGSVVTKDIPSNVVAVGNPCKVIKENK